MKKFFLLIAIILVAIFSYNSTAYAEEETCTSELRNELTKKASNVVATYEFVYNQINEVVGFDYVVYNVPSGMAAEYVIKKTTSESVFKKVNDIPVDSETGIGRIRDDNITDAYSVIVRVYSKDSPCKGSLKTVSFNKVKFNNFSELEQCQYEGMEDFTYCQQWIEQDFPYSDEDIIDRIDQQVEKMRTRTTVACLYCDQNRNSNDIYETIVKIRKYAIIGLSIGAGIDFILIIISIKKTKESRI